MKPFLETLPRQPDSSLAMLNRRLDTAIPFEWHHHPEYELTLTLNSRGQRFIGDHVGDYDDEDLVLVGPNLPHTWASHQAIDGTLPHVALVIWFHPEWADSVARDFIEFRSIGNLLARAGRGLSFPPEAAAAVRSRFELFFDQSAAERLLTLMNILDHLSGAPNPQPLASAPVSLDGVFESRERIDRVLTHVHAQYTKAITLPELADVAALSVSGLHRLFRKHTQGTVSDYVRALRIGDAAARLSSTNQPVAHIAAAVGYGALANFNRQFKAAKGMTPRDYRAHFRQG
ncbi:AraC family transcriptional regulator [Roseibium sp.]|uniref:AraC family transcriptional regulator n=1 Tax=Roseibium sp. TaxID=1936156 RepID=UPI003267C429